MMTGRNDLGSIKQARAAGISAYVAKPFSTDELRAKVMFLARPRG
jgi:DNA-binding response OmpR family regulator